MHKRKLSVSWFVGALLLVSACREAKAPGTRSALDTNTGDAFYSVNFVNENVGWLNGQTDRSFESPEENDNKNAKATKPGKKPEDPLKANQGFEVLQTTDGGQTWRQVPNLFKNNIR